VIGACVVALPAIQPDTVSGENHEDTPALERRGIFMPEFQADQTELALKLGKTRKPHAGRCQDVFAQSDHRGRPERRCIRTPLDLPFPANVASTLHDRYMKTSDIV